jgi:hypothetical protein
MIKNDKFRNTKYKKIKYIYRIYIEISKEIVKYSNEGFL